MEKTEVHFDLGVLILLCALFCLVVVAEKRLYTTTTNGLRGGFCFVAGRKFGLLAGCASFHKQ